MAAFAAGVLSPGAGPPLPAAAPLPHSASRVAPERAGGGDGAWASVSSALAASVVAGMAVGLRRRGRRGSRGQQVSLLAARRGKGGGKKGKGKRGKPQPKPEPEPEEEEDQMFLLYEESYTVAELAAIIKVPAAQIITYFFVEKGKPLTVNDSLDRTLMEDLCQHLEIEALFDEEERMVAAERGFLAEVSEDAVPRPPVVTVMGHVDHGKTTLLDTIRKKAVADTEAGGITQRIGAYTVDVADGKATFIDTPGHEAFTSMRARGAQVTDIAVLVVAANDGVMPQTREAIAHAKAAEVPIIVAINKIDVPNANPETAKTQLSEEGLICEEWGGDVTMVEVSAKQNINIDGLLEVITLTAEVGELKAAKTGHAAGIVLESTFDEKRGALATLLVQKGTLRVGEALVAGSKFCKVRWMKDAGNNDMKEVEPSFAVQVNGFTEAPAAGEQFEVYPLKEAKRISEERTKEESQKNRTSGFSGISMNESDKLMRLAVILKTDAQGSIAAVKHMFDSMKDSSYVNLRWVLSAPGPITTSDIELASTCPDDQRAMVLGFNSSVSEDVKKAAKQAGVEVQNFQVIYELFDTVVKALKDELGEEEVLQEKGQAECLAVFNGKEGKVCGCYVADGAIRVGYRVHCMRDGKKVGEGTISSIRRGKANVEEVDEDTECGFSADGFDEWEKGDIVQAFQVDMKQIDVVTQRDKGKQKVKASRA